jgi:CubicO group peptidase (beta-lactamase class C family)
VFALLKRAACAAALMCAWQVAALADATIPSLTKADVDAWLDGFMPSALNQGDIAGAVVVVVKNGGVLTQRGYGYSDLAARTPMDPQRTLMRVGSVSKLFTWTALMQLVERGKVALDEDVNTYLDFQIPAPEGKPITVRNLMTHTPGFEEQLKNAVAYDPAAARAFDALLKAWTPRRIFAPGTMPAYSNYATALGGYIVQRVSGMAFDDYMDAHVLGPLAMTSSTFRQPLPGGLQARMAKGYATASSPERPFEIVGLVPAGAMSAPASDIAKFMIAHLQQGRLGDAVILQPQTAQQMHTTALTILPRVDRMLLGFWEANYKGRRVIGHGGDTQWFHGDLRLFIDEGVGMYVAFNSMGKGLAAIEQRIALFEQFADRYLPVPGWTAGPGVEEGTALSHAKIIAGRYTSSRRAESSFMSLLNLLGSLEVIDYRDGTIGVSMVLGASGAPLRWREVDAFVWQLEGGSRLLSAELRNERIVRIAFEEISPFMMFERPPAWKGSWLLPVFLAALASLLITSVAWPIGALTRRYYGVQHYTQSQQGARTHRWLLAAAVATVLVWVAWATTIGTLMSDLANLSPRADGWLWILQGLSAITVVGGVVVGSRHVVSVVRSQRRWYAKAWATLLAIALMMSLWVAVAYNVIAFRVNY